MIRVAVAVEVFFLPVRHIVKIHFKIYYTIFRYANIDLDYTHIKIYDLILAEQNYYRRVVSDDWYEIDK